jgi:site-specific recombinase XerD
MNNPAISISHNTPSAIEIPPSDQPQPIRYWQQKFERYLQLIGRGATRERYARALERFLGKHPEKVYPHDFLRPVINDYVQTRFAEGASVATIRVELSAMRGFWKFMAEVEAFGVFFNVATGVKVRSRNHIGKIDSEKVASTLSSQTAKSSR